MPVIHREEKIVQNPVDLIVEVPRPQIIEKTIEVPKIQIEEKIIRVPKVQQTVVDTVVQHQIQTVEVVRPKIIQKIIQRKKLIMQEQIVHVPTYNSAINAFAKDAQWKTVFAIAREEM